MQDAYKDVGGRTTQETKSRNCRGAIGSDAGWRSLLNQLSEQEQKQFQDEHFKEIEDVVGNEGVWFNTEVLIAVGEKP